jgi:hypothetical protein
MKTIIVTLGLALAAALPVSTTLAQSTNSPSAKTPAPEVRDVASKPSAYLGPLTLNGVVGIVTPKKGFVLVDLKEFQEEGFGCLASDEPTKISVGWTGTAPKVKDKVRIEGKLVREKKGYKFTAEKVEKQ